MRNNYFALITLLIVVFELPIQAQRYLDMVFDEVTVESDITYGENISVITYPVTGAPSLQSLKMDVYSPAGDSEKERPLVLFFHGGAFLPVFENGFTGGNKTDSFAVEMCTRLARMGYVAASVDYRLGWNPLAANPEDIVHTLISAIYRGVQDSRTCMRYFRKTVAEEGNPYGICPDKITIMGEGHGGGYLALASATLDEYNDLLIPKFIYIDNSGNAEPMIIQPMDGDLNAETTIGINPLNGDTLSLINHPGYDSEAQLCVNFSGALADTSWLDGDDPPFISFHVPDDPLVPYVGEYLVVHPGTIVIEVFGSYTVARRANQLGNNQVFSDAGLQDDFTLTANENNDGFEGLFPMLRPPGTSPLNGSVVYEHAPWGWWDVDLWSEVAHPNCPPLPLDECNYHVINLHYNPDMSPEKGRVYMDTILGYFAPRAFAALGLAGGCSTGIEVVSEIKPTGVSIFPNPAKDELTIKCQANEFIQRIELYNITGQCILNISNLKHQTYLLKLNNQKPGIYFAKIYLDKKIISSELILIE